MEAITLTLLLISILLSSLLFFLLFPFKNPRLPLPPGPPSIPLLGNLLWFNNSTSLGTIETLLKNLRSKLGPIITLRFGSSLSIFITDRSLAHKALIELGATFSSRPPPPASRFLSGRIKPITSSPYGHHWRLLRRNLTSEFLHMSKIRLFAPSRRWVLGLLLRDLNSQQPSPVVAIESFKLAMFALLVLMCFGEKLDEKAIRDIQIAQRDLVLYSSKISRVLAFVPKLFSGFMFQGRLRVLEKLRQRQIELFIPLIRGRRENLREEGSVYSYVDSLLNINLGEDEGESKLTDDEMIQLCTEFLAAGTDTSATALEWIMAEIVARADVQAKLVDELEKLGGEDVKEEDLHKLPYLKAVVLEGLRRYPPTHFLVPHSATEDVEFEGYFIPKNATVNITLAEFGWDEKIWEDPMEFKPERFVAGGEGEGVDITGSREIKMLPFGAGRRICPGMGLAILHLEYFVANLVRKFQWEKVDGEEIDFSEKFDLTVVMKNPLRARITPRRK